MRGGGERCVGWDMSSGVLGCDKRGGEYVRCAK